MKDFKSFLIGLCILIIIYAVSPATATSCSLVGQWDRQWISGVYNYYEDGKVTYVEGTLRDSGSWVLNNDGSYTVSWPHGPGWVPCGVGCNYVDNIKISSDCNSYTGGNNYGESLYNIRSKTQPPSPTIQQAISTTSVTPHITIIDSIHPPDSSSAKSSSENIFSNVLLIPLIVIIIALLIIGALYISIKKKSSSQYTTSSPSSFTKQYQESSQTTYSNVPPQHHDVFISYAHQDKTIADAICGTLETNRIRCWIAPRDILPGMNYQESIIDAIEASRIMVLVYSSFTNNSPHIIRELTKAVSKNVIIIPFRIEDAPLSKSMEYLISIPHWLDAMTPPLEVHINKLAQDIQNILAREKNERK